MSLSSLADYAVVMMSAAARHCGGIGAAQRDGARRGDRPAAADRAEAGEQLSAAGLIESPRGTGGGFRLSRPPAAISLADIVEAIEGPIAMTACVDHGAHDCASRQAAG